MQTCGSPPDRSTLLKPCTQLEGPVNYSITSGSSRVSVRQEPSMDEADCMLKTTKVMGHVTREPCPPPPPPPRVEVFAPMDQL